MLRLTGLHFEQLSFEQLKIHRFNEIKSNWLFIWLSSMHINSIHVAFWSTPRIYCWASWFKGDGLDFSQKCCITLTFQISTNILPQITNCGTIRHVPFVGYLIGWKFGAALKHEWSKPFKRSIFQIFWNQYSCTIFLFLELKTSNLVYLLIF